jgi:hypothetical protein
MGKISKVSLLQHVGGGLIHFTNSSSIRPSFTNSSNIKPPRKLKAPKGTDTHIYFLGKQATIIKGRKKVIKLEKKSDRNKYRTCMNISHYPVREQFFYF